MHRTQNKVSNGMRSENVGTKIGRWPFVGMLYVQCSVIVLLLQDLMKIVSPQCRPKLNRIE